MSAWRASGGVLLGTVITLVAGSVILVVLPIAGLVTAAVLGNWVPIWVFSLPLVFPPLVGGAAASLLHDGARASSALLGGLGAALGVSVFGGLAGLVLLLIALGMTPTHGAPVDVSESAIWFTSLGVASGFATGAVLGALGGLAGQEVRKRRAR